MVPALIGVLLKYSVHTHNRNGTGPYGEARIGEALEEDATAHMKQNTGH